MGVKFDTEEEKISEKKKKSICTDEMIKKKNPMAFQVSPVYWFSGCAVFVKGQHNIHTI